MRSTMGRGSGSNWLVLESKVCGELSFLASLACLEARDLSKMSILKFVTVLVPLLVG
jgi:hypothetical protein